MKKFVEESKIYKPSEIEEVLKESVDGDELVYKRENKSTVYLFNIPCSFDIETTSFYIDNLKTAIMYEWTFGINGYVIIGRTWEEYKTMIESIVKHLKLNSEKRLVIYVHNLGFEFQFMRKHFTWEKVFSVDPRKPVYAITNNGIEYRCSFLLSGYALSKLSDEIQKYKIRKMVGDLDYSLMRHSKTVLTDKELKYCENDVRVVMAYIQERIEIDGDISRIPITKTGYVRRYCRNSCLYKGTDHKKNVGKWASYRDMMNALTLDVDEYKQLQRAFQGGFTHANAYYSEQELERIASYDFTSSYPYVMVSEKFPMSKGILVNGNGQLHSKEELNGYLNSYCCLFDITFHDIMTKVNFENPISESRCYGVKNAVVDNGRIVCADEITTTITELDMLTIQQAYSWESATIYNFRIYQRGYLPTDFIKSILKLYSDKTTLKGVEGKEIEYLMGKSMLNSAYGMCVTDICRDDNIYDSENHMWSTVQADVAKNIEDYNNSVKRFLFYPWGVWVTAYARRNLFTGIFEFQHDYVYSDTDSVKVFNHEAHKDYITRYNDMCRVKLEMACKYHNIPFEMVEPSTIKGEKKLLGVWDFEGIYDKFKTLGAKRYMVEKDGKISITVSGVNKSVAVPYMLEKYGKENIFEAFDNDLYIPPDYTGKNTHTYIDDVRIGILTDYNGIEAEFEELSGVHLEKADYSLSMSIAYIDYIKGIRVVEK